MNFLIHRHTRARVRAHTCTHKRTQVICAENIFSDIVVIVCIFATINGWQWSSVNHYSESWLGFRMLAPLRKKSSRFSYLTLYQTKLNQLNININWQSETLQSSLRHTSRNLHNVKSCNVVQGRHHVTYISLLNGKRKLRVKYRL